MLLGIFANRVHTYAKYERTATIWFNNPLEYYFNQKFCKIFSFKILDFKIFSYYSCFLDNTMEE